MTFFYPGWPYAAKAVIQHEFVSDHLNVWITFSFSMKQTVKPANNLWIVSVDDVVLPVSSSTWQDAWTMLLVVPDVLALPFRVLVAYDGPDSSLVISWLKQWEPWGPILSLDITT